MFQELLGPLSRPLFSSVGSELVEVAPADRAGPTFSEPNFLLFLPCSSTLRQRKGPLLVQTYFHGGGLKATLSEQFHITQQLVKIELLIIH